MRVLQSNERRSNGEKKRLAQSNFNLLTERLSIVFFKQEKHVIGRKFSVCMKQCFYTQDAILLVDLRFFLCFCRGIKSDKHSCRVTLKGKRDTKRLQTEFAPSISQKTRK